MLEIQKGKGTAVSNEAKCSCSGSNALLFCCSGAADIAEIGDRAVRAVHKSGVARMFCLAGIAGKVETIEVKTLAADRLVVVDGCDSDCAKKTMIAADILRFEHLRVSDLGFEKGKTPVTEDRIALVAAKIRELLAQPAA